MRCAGPAARTATGAALALVLALAAGCAPRPAGAGPGAPGSPRPGDARAPVSASAPPAPSSSAAPPVGPPVQTVPVHIHTSPLPSVLLDAVAFGDAQHGWAAGQGTILATTDGGAHWDPQYTGGADIVHLDAVDAAHAWAVARSSLLATTDGGTRWTALGEPAGAPLQSVDFVSPLIGYGVTAAGAVRTSNGGTTWTALPPVTGPAAPEGAGVASASGAATGAAAAAGLAGPSASQRLAVSAVCFATPQDGWAAVNPAPGTPTGAVGQVLRTTDGGQTWSVSFAPARTGVETVEQLGCAGEAAWVELGGDSGMMQHAYSVFRTEDGGATWAPELTIDTAGAGPGPGPTKGASKGPGLAPGPLAVAAPAEAYFFGQVDPGSCGPLQPVGTTDGGATWTNGSVVAGGTTCPVVGGYPDAAFLPGGRGWLVAGIDAGHSAIFATADGGRTWSEEYPSTALEPTVDVDFLSPADGFGLGTLGDGAAVLRTSDGGRTWARIADLPDDGGAPSAQWITFADAEHGWAVSGNGTLLATADGGADWAPVPVPADARPVFGPATLLSPQVGCLQSFSGVAPPLCTADGGATWQAAAHGKESAWTAAAALLRLPLAAALSGRYPAMNTPIVGGATGPDSAWMANYIGLYTTTDSGAHWTRFTWPEGAGGPGLAVSFPTAADGWMLGGGLFATTDGGAVWTQIGGA